MAWARKQPKLICYPSLRISALSSTGEAGNLLYQSEKIDSCQRNDARIVIAVDGVRLSRIRLAVRKNATCTPKG